MASGPCQQLELMTAHARVARAAGLPLLCRQRQPGQEQLAETGYTSHSGLSTDDPLTQEQPSGSSMPDSPASSAAEGRASQRSRPVPHPTASPLSVSPCMPALAVDLHVGCGMCSHMLGNAAEAAIRELTGLPAQG